MVVGCLWQRAIKFVKSAGSFWSWHFHINRFGVESFYDGSRLRSWGLPLPRPGPGLGATPGRRPEASRSRPEASEREGPTRAVVLQSVGVRNGGPLLTDLLMAVFMS